jgi:hypothetical protein
MTAAEIKGNRYSRAGGNPTCFRVFLCFRGFFNRKVHKEKVAEATKLEGEKSCNVVFVILVNHKKFIYQCPIQGENQSVITYFIAVLIDLAFESYAIPIKQFKIKFFGFY